MEATQALTQALDDTGGGSGDDEDFMEKVVARVKLVGAPGTLKRHYVETTVTTVGNT